ncbi:phosphatases II [Lentinus tigrinus ALCF2SS1-6]|uniref:protein-tyrosine-phosphatase n=1 Tax=Lentinus tigrinus ALCF2SS1-6 TaxID=1328759 RepID=A0A5C2SIV3_9APHY|nr:phosphatases II [Lentinus tigrinus ALCF2SS1-6]
MPVLDVDVLPLKHTSPRTLVPEHRSPPRADTLVSMLRSLTVDDYFQRRALRNTCTQRSPVDDFFPQASEIIPGLFVADLYTATSLAVLEQLAITHVVSVVRKPDFRYPRTVKHLCIPVEDRTDNDLLGYLDHAVAWIRDALAQDGRVLVHCVWGMSRSASVMLAYLIAARSMSLDEALRIVRARRQIVRPNSGFMTQLKVYERVTRMREAQEKRRRERSESEAELDLDALARRLGISVAVLS